jgi:hypothetical protein
MLPGGVICLNDFSSAMGVAVRKSEVDRYILMNEGSRGTEQPVLLCWSNVEITGGVALATVGLYAWGSLDEMTA